jgi:hypothetical protein
MSMTDSTLTTQPTDAERAAGSTLLRMIWGIHTSRAVYAVAELGIADLLADGPVSSTELARATGTHEPSLYRVLRLLAALGVLEEHAEHSFSATMVGERLRTAAPAGMRSWATFLEVLGGVRPFAHILQTLKTGRSGREIEFGVELFASIAEDPNAQRSSTPQCQSGPQRTPPASQTDTTSQTHAESSTSVEATGPCWSRSYDETPT